MTDEVGLPDEMVEIDEERWILLVFDRRWPKYVVSWSIRQKAGDSDFPLAGGDVEALPSRQMSDPDEIWSSLRQQALDQAGAARSVAEPEKPRPRGLFSRLFGRD